MSINNATVQFVHETSGGLLKRSVTVRFKREFRGLEETVALESVQWEPRECSERGPAAESVNVTALEWENDQSLQERVRLVHRAMSDCSRRLNRKQGDQ